MNSRERIAKTLSHEQPDKIAVDFGSTPVTGMHVSIVYKLRQYYGLDSKGTPVKVTEPLQMLGEIEDDLKEVICCDFKGLALNGTFYGFKKENWKEWKLYDGTPVLVPGLFNTRFNDDGSLFQYPGGDTSLEPGAKMPAKGFFFDPLIRQKPFIESDLDPEDNLEEFKILSDEDIEYLKRESEEIYSNSEYATIAIVANSSFGDIAIVPGSSLVNPRGIRDFEEWYISLFTRKDFIRKVFGGQMEVALENYRKVNELLGDRINVVYSAGTDFGMQQGTLISVETFRDLFKPFYKKINEWIHDNTGWKTFMHSCGSIYELIPDIIESGFDILNPLQIAAKDMDPARLKKEFGKDLVFWGGGINTQGSLANGTPQEVKEEARRLIDIFNAGGGFVFNTVHNIQANVPIENVVAMIEVIREYRK